MESKEKKQVVSAIQKATNILVTVGVDPSVDELSALLGLTLLLGKIDKHATSVFSGRIPSAISFLEPEKTFEDTVDGLRDFIIALNKDKADHLRYKLDGDVVKIFITPYKNTIIRDTDLQFSQGDFNVDLILALGVEDKTDLDSAVASHGRILHDATTITISSGSQASKLGEIDWHADSASSLCEMIVSLSRDLGDSLLDEHVATALLTGIVSNTERFSNNLTTSDVMKTAATLMAAGANQQLIAAQVTPEEPEPKPVREATPEPKPEPEPEDATINSDGSMQIKHESKPEPPRDAEPEELPPLPSGPSLVDIERDKDQVLQDALDKVIPASNVDLDDLIDAEHGDTPAPAPAGDSDHTFVSKANGYDDLDAPSLGGTLNATTEQAEEESRAAIEDDRNRVILSHDAPPAELPDTPPAPAPEDTRRPDEPQAAPAPAPAPAPEKPAPEPTPAPSAGDDALQHEQDALATLGYPAGSHPTLADLDQKTGHADAPKTAVPLEVDDARAAVATALDTAFSPANNPAASVGSQPLGDNLHDDAAPTATASPVSPTAISLPPLPPLPPLPGQTDGLPPLPPLPDLSELDAHADPAKPAPAAAAAPAPTTDDWQAHTVEPPAGNDPGQFHIPGQQ